MSLGCFKQIFLLNTPANMDEGCSGTCDDTVKLNTIVAFSASESVSIIL